MSESKPKAPKRRRRFGIWLLLSLMLMAAVLLLAVLSFTGRAIPVPDWMAQKAEARLNVALAPMQLTLGGAEVVFTPRGMPQVHLRDVEISDGDGRPLARMPELDAAIAGRPLLDRQIVVHRVALKGAEVTLRRDEDGRFDLALGDSATPFRAASIGEVLDQIDQAFSTPALSAIEAVTAESLQLTYEDARAGRAWQVRDGLLTLDQSATDVSARLFFSLTNDRGEPSEAALSFETEKGSPASKMSANFSDMPSGDIATQSPALAFLTVIDAPISGALRTGVNADGTLAPLSAALEIGAGALHPVDGATPIRFDRGKSYFSYDPAAGKITFDEISVSTAALSLQADGHAYLRDEVDGWPTSLITQMRLRQVTLTPEGVFAEPAVFSGGAVDLKLVLDPFTATIGQAVLSDDSGADYRGSGKVRADTEGWQVDINVAIDQVTRPRLLALWPVSVVPHTRDWVSDNVQDGVFFDVRGALRLAYDKPPVASLSYEFRDAKVHFMKTMPPVTGGFGYSTLTEKTFTMVLDSGSVEAPQGGKVDAAGTVVHVADITQRPARGEITLRTEGSVEAMLSLLDLPPLNLMSRAGQPVTLAQGRARAEAKLGLSFKKGLQPKDVDYSVAATLSGITSDRLVTGRVLAADTLNLSADKEELSISGSATLDGVPVQGVWSQRLGPESGGNSRVEGTVELSQRAVDTFKIGLPRGTVSGQGLGDMTLELRKGAPVAFKLSSDLNRVGLRLPSVGWSKARNAKGTLEVSGTLSSPPVISRLAFSAPGLSTEGGKLRLTADGGLRDLSFSRVRLNGWLDAPVTLTGRGKGRDPAIALTGGTVDLRKSPLTKGGSSGTGGSPIKVALNNLVVSSGITLTGVRGDLAPTGGMSGSLSGTVKGGAQVRISLVPAAKGTAIRVRSKDAGGVLRGAGVFEKSNGGSLDLTLTPRGPPGDYDGVLSIKRTRVKGAPALAELLSAISVVGILEMLDGEGLVFSDVSAEFRLTPAALEVRRGSAVGASLGISMAGLYTFADNNMKMQGVISPIYILNGVGALVSRRGEGLFGFNYSLTGNADNPRVGVNPLSLLTPGIFRELFRARPPELAN